MKIKSIEEINEVDAIFNNIKELVVESRNKVYSVVNWDA